MPWATFLLLLVSGYVTVKLVSLTRTSERLKYLGLTIASAIFLVMQGTVFVDLLSGDNGLTEISAFIVEWGHVSSLAFVLSSLAVFIRESKPVFAQFPMLYTALPLLIVLSYILVKDTYAIKTWLVAIYQGGAITVALLMYGVYAYRRASYVVILSGVCIFLLSHILFWYVPGVQQYYPWIWKLLLAMGMIITILGYEKAEVQEQTEPSLN